MEKITSRAIRGEFAKRLQLETPPSWFNSITNTFRSDQAAEEYAFLDAVGPLREWVGGRQAQGFKESSFTIENKHFEKTIEIPVKDMRRDKLDLLRAKVADVVKRAMTHPASMVSTLIKNGESGVCYDGQYFFDTDHEEGNSGTQSNKISVDISSLPVSNHGSTTLPSVAEFQLAIAQGVQQFMTFVDPAGEPMNEDANNFVIMVPTSYYNVANTAVATPLQVAESQTGLSSLKQDYTVRVVVNPRLSTWSNKFAMFNTDGYIKPFVFQRETATTVASIAEGSEYEFKYKKHQHGVDYWGNAAYGLWHKACLITLT